MRPRIGWGALAIIGASLAGGLWLAGPAGASGGGGCGLPVTDAHGTRVHVKNFCFTPTVLHVRRGQAVTFTNRDAFAHTVSGANVVWGSFDSLTFGKPVTYRFERPGVYPYFCAIHPGMVGAIVVGNGNGRGDANRTTTERGPVVLVKHLRPVPPAAAAVVPLPDGSGSLPWPAATLVGIGLLAVAGLALLQLRQQMKS
jgi:plastocyanin